MQTFLPYPDFCESLSCLDTKRLGKQRLEAYQLIQIIKQLKSTNFLGRGKIGYGNHPATIMWENNLDALIVYYNTALMVWNSKGFKNEVLQSIELPQGAKHSLKMPWFIGVKEFHESHQSNLIRKDSDFYSPQFPKAPKNVAYLWPKIIKGKNCLITIEIN